MMRDAQAVWTPPRRRLAIGAVLVLLLVVVAGIVLREPLADMLWPQTRAQRLVDDAARALRQGRLSNADGSGARELYQAAVALDPDATAPREGLTRVAEAALAQAEQAGQALDFTKAHAMLTLARQLSAPRERWVEVSDAIRKRERSHAGLDAVLARADQAHRAGRLLGEEGALELYARVLALEPGQTQALEGREDALSDLLVQAHSRLDAADLPKALAVIDQVRDYDPGHIGLPDAEARLTLITEAERTRAQRLQDGGELEAAALAHQGILALHPDDAHARDALRVIANALAERAGAHASEFRFDQAEADLQRARALDPQASGIASAESHLRQARQSGGRFQGPRTPAERERVQQLLAEAEQAQQRGDLLHPPGDSAYDKLRAAQAIAPNDAAVRIALQRLLPSAQGCFERELRNNSLAKARACLDAWAMLQGNATTLDGQRRRLAARWLAVGAERLGGGDVPGAQAALQSASSIDQATPGLQEFGERVRSASLAQP